MKEKVKAVPAPAIPAALKPALDEWRSLVEWMEKAKPREMELRKQLSEVFFPSPIEGTNRIITADGYEFTLEHKINRSIDEAALAPVMAELPENSPFRQPGVLITWKPSLVLSGLRVMPDNERLIFSQAMTEKPGSPTLEVKPVDAEQLKGYEFTINSHPDFPASVSAAPATPISDAYQAAKAKATSKPATKTKTVKKKAKK